MSKIKIGGKGGSGGHEIGLIVSNTSLNIYVPMVLRVNESLTIFSYFLNFKYK